MTRRTTKRLVYKIMTTRLTIILAVLCIQQLLAMKNLTVVSKTVNPLILSGYSPGSCVSPEERQAAIVRLDSEIKMNIINIIVRECGPGLWYPIASLDMTDPQQQCPTGWMEYHGSSVRACGRPETNSPSCTSISYATGHLYSKVCGRVIGYQVASPDGFLSSGTIDENYVDGVSITYGRNPRRHIWTYAAGVTENSTDHTLNNCPCWDLSAEQPPGFVGEKYFCESANPSDIFDSTGFLYGSDKLWDNQQCSNEGTCCTSLAPPWFTVTLSDPTTDDIEVRICGDESTNNEDTPIELLDIFIQ